MKLGWLILIAAGLWVIAFVRDDAMTSWLTAAGIGLCASYPGLRDKWVLRKVRLLLTKGALTNWTFGGRGPIWEMTIWHQDGDLPLVKVVLAKSGVVVGQIGGSARLPEIWIAEISCTKRHFPPEVVLHHPRWKIESGKSYQDSVIRLQDSLGDSLTLTLKPTQRWDECLSEILRIVRRYKCVADYRYSHTKSVVLDATYPTNPVLRSPQVQAIHAFLAHLPQLWEEGHLPKISES